MAAAVDNTERAARSGSEWREAKEKVRLRDQYRCQYCRIRDGPFVDLQVHHIKPLKNGGSDKTSNLALLCNSCHWKLHTHFDDRERLPPSLLDQHNPSRLAFKDYRTPISNLSGAAQEIVALLRKNGPMQLKNIIDETGYSRGYVNKQLDSLKFGKIVCRVSRGVYGYITVLEYRELARREENEHGRIDVGFWDPGKQSTLDEWSEHD